MTDPSRRKAPNVLLTGTPGTGKTALASLLSERLRLRHVDVGQLVEAHRCYDDDGQRDELLDTHVLDDDKLLDVLEPLLEDSCLQGQGVVIDYHGCDLFPERYFDLVLVLRCETHVLYDRLTTRGYSDLKRNENVTAEIMQVLLEEAKQAYDPNIVHEVPSNTLDDMDSNVDRVKAWMEKWIQDRRKDSGGGGDDDDDDYDDSGGDREEDDEDSSPPR